MIEQPPKNTMMQAPPAKKEFHFAATTEHFAEVIYAATIAEAEALYHKIKRPINPISTPAPAAAKEETATD
jgi:hypothetical protein